MYGFDFHAIRQVAMSEPLVDYVEPDQAGCAPPLVLPAGAVRMHVLPCNACADMLRTCMLSHGRACLPQCYAVHALSCCAHVCCLMSGPACCTTFSVMLPTSQFVLARLTMQHDLQVATDTCRVLTLDINTATREQAAFKVPLPCVLQQTMPVR